MFHTLGGGCGSGLGSLILEKLDDVFQHEEKATVSIFPSHKVSDFVGEAYNATLSIDKLIENSSSTFIVDNGALFNISTSVYKKRQPRYRDLNLIISSTLMDVTAPFRFPGSKAATLSKLRESLVPYGAWFPQATKVQKNQIDCQRLHFYTMAHAPMVGRNGNVRALVSQVKNQRCSLSEMTDGKYLAQSYIFRGGGMTQNEISAAIAKTPDDFVEYLKEGKAGLTNSIIEKPPSNIQRSCTMVSNTTSSKDVFQDISAQFAKMYKRKAFVHWYKDEGMDEMEFQEADKSVRDLITQYHDTETAAEAWD